LATPIPIIDADDPRLAPFRAVRERDIVGRSDGCIAEGEVVLPSLLASPAFAVDSVLVSTRVAFAGRPWFAELPRATSLFSVDDAVMERLAGFHVHRGILAFARRVQTQTLGELVAALPQRATVLVAVGIANHDNMGGLFRNAAAFGADAVICDGTSCDPLYRKAIRVSVGGVFKVPFVRQGKAADILDALEAAGFTSIGLTPGGTVALHGLKIGPRAALVLGAEGPGLSTQTLARLMPVRIDMAPGFDSLNVATAGAIALHQLFNR
jgi:tRNA G18 (ribose-2'-O)-methylase SpoU